MKELTRKNLIHGTNHRRKDLGYQLQADPPQYHLTIVVHVP